MPGIKARLFGHPIGSFGRCWWNTLQAEHLAPRLRSNGNPVGNGPLLRIHALAALVNPFTSISLQLEQGVIVVAVQQQIGVFHIPLQPAFLFQIPADTLAELMHQGTQFFPCGSLDAVKAHGTVLILGVDAVEKQHVKVHIEVQGRTKALNQGNGVPFISKSYLSLRYTRHLIAVDAACIASARPGNQVPSRRRARELLAAIKH